MNFGDLRSAFRGVAWKRLTPHEVDPKVSNGHEFQGVDLFREVLGTTRTRFPATYMMLKDDTDDIETIESWANWYDSRENDPKRSAEFRLYYPAEGGEIQSRLNAGDLMVVAVTSDSKLALMFAAAGTSREAQLQILFQIGEKSGPKGAESFENGRALGFVAASIAEELGFAKVEAAQGDDSQLVLAIARELTEEYPEFLPSGRVISALVRSRIGEAAVLEDPDLALTRWIEAEAAIFRTWEDSRIAERLRVGFQAGDGSPDVQSFRDFSMSIRQSRVSRAGGALEDHFADVLRAHKIKYIAQARIDGGKRPDFLFPGKTEYENASFPKDRLRILGAKFTAKERWVQVLSEAERVDRKHLLTFDASITGQQLLLMKSSKLQLVIPRPIQDLYSDSSRSDLMSVNDFLNEIKSLQMN
jgi:hypothetical protein